MYFLQHTELGEVHKIIKDDPEMALEFIAFISLLAKLADKTTK